MTTWTYGAVALGLALVTIKAFGKWEVRRQRALLERCGRLDLFGWQGGKHR